MQVNCPNCGAKVTAANMNVQNMTAVCSACDSLFTIEPPQVKAKRRKIKQPKRLTLRDADTLRMEFSRSDRSVVFLLSMFGVIMGAVDLLLLSEGAPIILTLLFFLITAVLFYGVALNAFNRTRLEMDEDSIKITQAPIPNPLNQENEVSLAGVTAIKYEESAISKKEGYAIPLYRVWAQTDDGVQRMIVNDVTEEYAVFIAQHLSERLQMNGDVDVSRLEDVEHGDDEADMREGVLTARNNAK